MTRPDQLAFDSPPAPAPARFRSILFADAGGEAGAAKQPSFFADLNLDQVLDSVTAGREEYDLRPFFCAPLHDAETVEYRHEVLLDLRQAAVAEPVGAFAQTMRSMRERLGKAEKLHYAYQQKRWFLDAAEVYCDAVAALAGELASAEPESRGFRALREYLREYTASAAFTSLAAETREIEQALGEVRYSVQIRGNRVRVGTYGGEADYSTEVEQTFARFEQGAVKDYRAKFPAGAELDHVEAHVLELVAQLHPGVFRRLDEHCARHRDFLDATIGAFDREVQFYLAYLEHTGRLEAAGLPFCLPQVTAGSKQIQVLEAFDLALAAKLVAEGTRVVCNDFSLDDAERIIVVTGPNNGGKTTFARMFGQLHYLASLGLPVPAREARLSLPDRVFTHFEREEEIETLRGKLEDELVRVHEILEQATGDSILVLNESFSSTTLNDALVLGTEVLRRIVDLGPLAVYVTFVDELASLGEATVSMVSTVVPEDPAKRTFEIVRKPADGLAYAWAIAAKYGLGYERLKERVVA